MIPHSRDEFEAMPAEARMAYAQLVRLVYADRPLWPSEARRLRELAAQFGLTLEWRQVNISD